MRFVRWLLYLALFGAGVAGGTYLLLRLSFSGTVAVVPPVVGLTQEQADFQARRAHLLFAVRSEQFDLSIPKGSVVAQTPAAGMPTRHGITLSVVVSKGIERIDTPDFTGKRIDDAQLGIRQGGLKLASTAFVRGPQPAQTVVAQDPPAGTVVPRDSEVTLLVSSGAPGYTFLSPDLTGTQVRKAQIELEGYGIQTTLAKPVKPSSAAPGAIVSQSPAPGLPLGRGDLVQLTVSEP